MVAGKGKRQVCFILTEAEIGAADALAARTSASRSSLLAAAARDGIAARLDAALAEAASRVRSLGGDAPEPGAGLAGKAAALRSLDREAARLEAGASGAKGADLAAIGYRRMAGTPEGSAVFVREQGTRTDTITFAVSEAGHRVTKETVRDMWSGKAPLLVDELSACARFAEEMGWARP